MLYELLEYVALLKSQFITYGLFHNTVTLVLSIIILIYLLPNFWKLTPLKD